MKKFMGLTLVVILLLIFGSATLSCVSSSTGGSFATTIPTTTSGITTPYPSATPTKTTLPSSIRIEGQKAAEEAIKNSTTFKFDGIAGSIKLIKYDEFSPISAYIASTFIYEFQTSHPGHGDRTGQVLAQVITTHTVTLYYNIKSSVIHVASCDGKYNLLTDKVFPVYVSGIVVSGGDTTPPGLMDAPRKFVYKIEKKDHTFVNVSYAAYPPSPAGDAAMAKIRLEFESGSIRIGDFLEALGTLDEATNTVVVANEGDYIRTMMNKVEIIGQVVSGGDTTPKGLLDAPRKFVYSIQRDDGTYVEVQYTTYPPSPAGDVLNAKITLSFYNGDIKIGDYLKAYGTYFRDTGILTVADEGDFLKTYPTKP